MMAVEGRPGPMSRRIPSPIRSFGSGLSMAWIAAFLGFGLLVPAPAPDGPGSVTLHGRAVELSAVLQARGLKADAEPIAQQVVLLAEDGTVTPLLPNAASRALFRDERLRGRPTEVVGERVEGLPYLNVVAFRIEEQGVLRTPEYHCEVCTIDVRAPQDCPCCQGPMELRFQPPPER
jgi:hypothetical protein